MNHSLSSMAMPIVAVHLRHTNSLVTMRRWERGVSWHWDGQAPTTIESKVSGGMHPVLNFHSYFFRASVYQHHFFPLQQRHNTGNHIDPIITQSHSSATWIQSSKSMNLTFVPTHLQLSPYTPRNTGNYISESVQGAAAGGQKEAHKRTSPIKRLFLLSFAQSLSAPHDSSFPSPVLIESGDDPADVIAYRGRKRQQCFSQHAHVCYKGYDA